MRIVDAMESDAQLAYLSEGYSMIRAISAALFELAPGTWRASRARKEVSDESKRRKPPPGHRGVTPRRRLNLYLVPERY
jgi:hypothetical protein